MRYKKHVVFLILFYCGVLFGQDLKPMVEIIRIYEEIPCPYLLSAPKIDGDISDVEWKGAFKISGFVLDNGSAMIKEGTEVLLGRDKNNLYLAFNCKDQRSGDIVSNEGTSPLDIWLEDSIEIFFCPFGSFPHFQYMVNAKGVSVKNLVKEGLGLERDGSKKVDVEEQEDAEWKKGVKIYENGWVCEVEIPHLKWGKNSLVFNLGRNIIVSQMSGGVNLCGQWCCTFGSSHKPEKYGKMDFNQDVGITDFKVVIFSKEKKKVKVKIKVGDNISSKDFVLEYNKEVDIGINEIISKLEKGEYDTSIMIYGEDEKKLLKNKYIIKKQ